MSLSMAAYQEIPSNLYYAFDKDGASTPQGAKGSVISFMGEKCIAWFITRNKMYIQEVLGAGARQKKENEVVLEFSHEVVQVQTLEKKRNLFMFVADKASIYPLKLYNDGKSCFSNLKPLNRISLNKRGTSIKHLCALDDSTIVIAFSNESLFYVTISGGKCNLVAVENGANRISQLVSSITSFLPGRTTEGYGVLAISGIGDQFMALCSDGYLRVWEKGSVNAPRVQIEYHRIGGQNRLRNGGLRRTKSSILIYYDEQKSGERFFQIWSWSAHEQERLEAFQTKSGNVLVDVSFTEEGQDKLVWVIEKIWDTTEVKVYQTRVRSWKRVQLATDQRDALLEEDESTVVTSSVSPESYHSYFMNRMLRPGRFTTASMKSALKQKRGKYGIGEGPDLYANISEELRLQQQGTKFGIAKAKERCTHAKECWLDFLHSCNQVENGNEKYCGFETNCPPNRRHPLLIKAQLGTFSISMFRRLDPIFGSPAKASAGNLRRIANSLSAFPFLQSNKSQLCVKLITISRMIYSELKNLSESLGGSSATRFALLHHALRTSQRFDVDGNPSKSLKGLFETWLDGVLSSAREESQTSRIENMQDIVETTFGARGVHESWKDLMEGLCGQAISETSYPQIDRKGDGKTEELAVGFLSSMCLEIVSERFDALIQILTLILFTRRIPQIGRHRPSQLQRYLSKEALPRCISLLLKYRRAKWFCSRRLECFSPLFRIAPVQQTNSGSEYPVEELAFFSQHTVSETSRGPDFEKPLLFAVVAKRCKEDKRLSPERVLQQAEEVSNRVVWPMLVDGNDVFDSQSLEKTFKLELILLREKLWSHLYDLTRFGESHRARSVEGSLFSDILQAYCALHAYRKSRAPNLLREAKRGLSRAAPLVNEEEYADILKKFEKSVGGYGNNSGTPELLRYFQWAAQEFETVDEETSLEFAKRCLPYLESDLHVAPENEAKDKHHQASTVWLLIYNFCMRLKRYDDAYLACISIPIQERAIDCLQHLADTLADKGKFNTLCNYPWTGRRSKVIEGLWRTARCTQLGDFHENSGEQCNLFHLIYSYLVKCNDFKGAAKYMLLYVDHIQNTSNLTDIACIKEQVNAYASAISALSLCKYQWVALIDSDNGNQRNMPLKRNREGRLRPELSLLKEAKGNVYTIRDIRQAHAVLCAKVQHAELTGQDPSTQISSASDMVTLLMKDGLIETAFRLSHLCSMELSHRFREFVQKCVQLQAAQKTTKIYIERVYHQIDPDTQEEKKLRIAQKAWRMLENLLMEYDDCNSNFRYRIVVAETILDYRNIKLPAWLMSMLVNSSAGHGFASQTTNIVSVVRLFTRYRMYEEAARTAMKQLKKLRSSNPRDLWLPEQLLAEILNGMASPSEKTTACADEDLKNLIESLNDELGEIRRSWECISPAANTSSNQPKCKENTEWPKSQSESESQESTYIWDSKHQAGDGIRDPIAGNGMETLDSFPGDDEKQTLPTSMNDHSEIDTEGPPQGTWKCPLCETINSTADNACHKCQTAQPGSALADSESKGEGDFGSGSGNGFSFGEGNASSSNDFGFGEGGEGAASTDGNAFGFGGAGSAANPFDTEKEEEKKEEERKVEERKEEKADEEEDDDSDGGGGWGGQFKPAEGTWSCPTCMVSNGPDETACKSCQTVKPGSAPAGDSFEFGAVSSESAQNSGSQSGSSGFQFGDSESKGDGGSGSGSGNGFSFGEGNASSSNGFGFGEGGEGAASTDGNAFGFGSAGSAADPFDTEKEDERNEVNEDYGFGGTSKSELGSESNPIELGGEESNENGGENEGKGGDAGWGSESESRFAVSDGKSAGAPGETGKSESFSFGGSGNSFGSGGLGEGFDMNEAPAGSTDKTSFGDKSGSSFDTTAGGQQSSKNKEEEEEQFTEELSGGFGKGAFEFTPSGFDLGKKPQWDCKVCLEQNPPDEQRCKSCGKEKYSES